MSRQVHSQHKTFARTLLIVEKGVAETWIPQEAGEAGG